MYLRSLQFKHNGFDDKKKLRKDKHGWVVVSMISLGIGVGFMSSQTDVFAETEIGNINDDTSQVSGSSTESKIVAKSNEHDDVGSFQKSGGTSGKISNTFNQEESQNNSPSIQDGNYQEKNIPDNSSDSVLASSSVGQNKLQNESNRGDAIGTDLDTPSVDQSKLQSDGVRDNSGEAILDDSPVDQNKLLPDREVTGKVYPDGYKVGGLGADNLTIIRHSNELDDGSWYLTSTNPEDLYSDINHDRGDQYLHFSGGTFNGGHNYGNGGHSKFDSSGTAYVKGIYIDVPVKTGTNASYLFADLPNVEFIKGLTNLDTSQTEDFSYMFGFTWQGNEILKTIDVSKFDTSKGKNFDHMFNGVGDGGFTDLDVSNFNMHNAENISAMFMGLPDLKNIDVTNWDTSNVRKMNAVFAGTKSLKHVNLTKWNTFKATDMSLLFSGSGLLDYDLSSFDTSNVKRMAGMFAHSVAKSVDLSMFDTHNVNDFSNMFSDTDTLNDFDLTGFDTSSATNMLMMFERNTAIHSLDLSNFDTSKVENFSYMFDKATNLKDLNLSNFSAKNALDMSYMFNETSSLGDIDLSKLGESPVDTLEKMFDKSGVKSINMKTFSPSRASNAYFAFAETPNLRSIDLSSFDLSSLTNGMGMFYKSALPSIDTSAFNITHNTDLMVAFAFMQKLKSINTSGLSLKGSQNILGLLGGNPELTSLDLTKFTFNNTVKADPDTYLEQYLALCPKISKLILSKNTVLTSSNLSEVPTDDTYTGKWVNVNNRKDALTSEELVDKYNGSGEGSTDTTYIWQTIKSLTEPDKPTEPDTKPDAKPNSGHHSSSGSESSINIKNINLTVGTYSDGGIVSLYESNGELVKNRGLSSNTNWYSDQLLTRKNSDGTTSQYFRVATNEYMKIEDGYIYESNKGVVSTKGLTYLYDSHGNRVSNRALKVGTKWVFDKTSTDIVKSDAGEIVINNGDNNGPRMYRVSTK